MLNSSSNTNKDDLATSLAWMRFQARIQKIVKSYDTKEVVSAVTDLVEEIRKEAIQVAVADLGVSPLGTISPPLPAFAEEFYSDATSDELYAGATHPPGTKAEAIIWDLAFTLDDHEDVAAKYKVSRGTVAAYMANLSREAYDWDWLESIKDRSRNTFYKVR